MNNSAFASVSQPYIPWGCFELLALENFIFRGIISIEKWAASPSQ
jgi:hypothetical protein